MSKNVIIGFVLYFLVCYFLTGFMRKATSKGNKYDYYKNNE